MYRVLLQHGRKHTVFIVRAEFPKFFGNIYYDELVHLQISKCTANFFNKSNILSTL